MWSLFTDESLIYIIPPSPHRLPWGFGMVRYEWVRLTLRREKRKKPQRKWGFWLQGKMLSDREPMIDGAWAPPPAVSVVLWFCVWSLSGATSVQILLQNIF